MQQLIKNTWNWNGNRWVLPLEDSIYYYWDGFFVSKKLMDEEEINIGLAVTKYNASRVVCEYQTLLGER